VAKKILVLHGPNLNMLGKREPDIYGSINLDTINKTLKTMAKKKGHTVVCEQWNGEGELVTAIQQAQGKYDALIINAAAYTHTSVAVRDALACVALTKIEAHLSNVHKREDFRHTSLISAVCDSVIAGFGAQSYYLALESLL